ncbi:hypothetical protein DSO57_1030214 [Entomophthora muscae]|uniref:Uncharacterized protein n=1 Tax=Entomophthora muscae TaxID=34485 RepID=A0ACC2TN38_9FUNG|nr:hypothetical protein DSO57_1030214 [Entomophthora muscae]
MIYDVDTFLCELVPEFGHHTAEQLYNQLVMFGFHIQQGDYWIGTEPAKWLRTSHPFFNRVSPEISLILNQTISHPLPSRYHQFEAANLEYLENHNPTTCATQPFFFYPIHVESDPQLPTSGEDTPELETSTNCDSSFQDWLQTFDSKPK